MVIYAEYLFLENFAVGLLLLSLTGKLISLPGAEPVSWKRLGWGAVLCGGSSFLIFMDCGTEGGAAAGLAVRIAAAALTCRIAFGRKNLVKTTSLFFILSFLSGGAAMAVLWQMEIPVLAGNGVVYLEAMTWKKGILCGLPAMAATAWFLNFIRKKRSMESVAGMAVLELEEHRCCLRSCVDSGNSLKEPLTGSPVVLIDKKGAEQLPFHQNTYPERFAVIPFQSVGVRKGVLKGLRLDRIRMGEQTLEPVILAYYEGDFPGFELLLHRNMIEGGMLEDGKRYSWTVFQKDNRLVEKIPEREAGKCVLHRRK